MYKVFNQHRAIIFTENSTFSELKEVDSIVELTRVDDIIPVYQEFVNSKFEGNLVFLIKNEYPLFVNKFLSHFQTIEAAGGLVKNSEDELLMIRRFGKWDLPKGKIEQNEKIKTAAIRECMEETALDNIAVINELESTYHIYDIDNIPMLKRTYWFEMKTEFGGQLIPQTEEGIVDARWMNKEEVVEAMKNTYESLKDLIENNYLKQ